MHPIGSVCGTRRTLTTLVAVGLALGLAALVLLAGDGTAAPAVKPANVVEPDVDGRPADRTTGNSMP